MSGDPDFDDFLRRRRPLFRREFDDVLEPPPEVDRIVLRQAREAIETDRPIRLFGMPQWAAPVAIAATLVVGLAVVFKAGTAPSQPPPEVRVQRLADQRDYPPPGAALAVESPAAATAADQMTPAQAVPESPAWRQDARTWQAEIARLRAQGDSARADAEQAEFNRRFRAMASAPDH